MGEFLGVILLDIDHWPKALCWLCGHLEMQHFAVTGSCATTTRAPCPSIGLSAPNPAKDLQRAARHADGPAAVAKLLSASSQSGNSLLRQQRAATIEPGRLPPAI